ncbi:tryptophan--tRNA ligase [Candidatus Woesearchaeota archaeon]|nr:tryptophan--tRNA ligase [Candidatus Woesearchaeota archaeon]
MQVTPWKVEGAIDYNKLVKEFGTKLIDKALLKRIEKYSKLNPMLRRGFVFSHRDLDLVLNDYSSGEGFFLYTGRAPSGPMHIGHLMPFYITKWFQDAFKVNLYIQIPDEEKFLAKKELTLEEVDKWVIDNILDIIAVGFDPDRTFIFQDREYIKGLYTIACRIAKKVNISTAKAVFGFNNESNIGIMFYPIMQNVPTFFEKKRGLIPSAIDQDPYWRIQRDIAEGMGYFKTAAVHCRFLPPLTGIEGKMSTSESDTAIYLHDSQEDVRKKIMKYAFSGGQATIEEHRKKGGNPEIDVSFQWLSIFFEEDDTKLKKIHDDYKSGKMLTSELKAILVNKINDFLRDHARKKADAVKLIKQFKYDGKLAKKMWDFEKNNL